MPKNQSLRLIAVVTINVAVLLQFCVFSYEAKAQELIATPCFSKTSGGVMGTFYPGGCEMQMQIRGGRAATLADAIGNYNAWGKRYVWFHGSSRFITVYTAAQTNKKIDKGLKYAIDNIPVDEIAGKATEQLQVSIEDLQQEFENLKVEIEDLRALVEELRGN